MKPWFPNPDWRSTGPTMRDLGANGRALGTNPLTWRYDARTTRLLEWVFGPA